MFVPGGLHGIQQWNEAVCDGAWGRPFAWLGEKLRRALDMEDWAAFDRSFRQMEDLIAEIATGPDAPSTVSILGGDIHFSYAAELQLRNGERPDERRASAGLLTDPQHPRETRTARPAASPRRAPGRWLAEHLQRWVRRPPSRFSWELEDDPLFANTMGSLRFEGERATVQLERAGHSDQGVEQPRRDHRPTIGPSGGPAGGFGLGLSSTFSQNSSRRCTSKSRSATRTACSLSHGHVRLHHRVDLELPLRAVFDIRTSRASMANCRRTSSIAASTRSCTSVEGVPSRKLRRPLSGSTTPRRQRPRLAASG